MRVLHVINSLSGSGGAEQGMVREAIRLHGVSDQRIVTLYHANGLSSQAREAGIECRSLSLDSARSGWNWWWAAWLLRREIDRYRPDVVHSSLFSANLAAQLAARRRSIPVLSTFTLSGDVDLMKTYQPGADQWKASLLRRVAAIAARSRNIYFRALTFDAKRTNSEALGVDESRVVVIPRGVPDPEVDRSLRPVQLGLPEDVPLILNVGRQTAQKGHCHLIAAFDRVRRNRPSHLAILGRRGDASGSLREAIRARGLEEDVTVVDYTEHVFDYYRAADVFAFSSLMEGLGTAVIEAMFAGLPVVAFDIPPIREVTDDGRVARLVDVADEGALAGAILDILDEDTDRVVLAKEARDWAREEFSIERVARRLSERLQELTSASPSGSAAV